MTERVWVKTIAADQLQPVAGLQGRWGRWVAPTAGNRWMIFGIGELQPGEVAGWHEHPEPEVFVVLEGQGEARWRDGNTEGRAELRPGVAFYKIGGIAHQMINLGEQPLRGVFFKVGSE